MYHIIDYLGKCESLHEITDSMHEMLSVCAPLLLTLSGRIFIVDSLLSTLIVDCLWSTLHYQLTLSTLHCPSFIIDSYFQPFIADPLLSTFYFRHLLSTINFWILLSALYYRLFIVDSYCQLFMIDAQTGMIHHIAQTRYDVTWNFTPIFIFSSLRIFYVKMVTSEVEGSAYS